MRLSFSPATTPTARARLFHARYVVFVEECAYAPPRPDRQLADRFDALPQTVNFRVLHRTKVIGGIRHCTAEAGQTPYDHLFDFRPYLPTPLEDVAFPGMIFVDAAWRSLRGLQQALAVRGLVPSVASGCSHVCTVVAPSAERLCREVGFRPVVERSRDLKTGLWVRPMIARTEDLHPDVAQLAREGTLRWDLTFPDQLATSSPPGRPELS